ncbi:MAG: hypothetical protein WA285_01625 [Mycobacterium sp.]|uniref:hypothetical protein n=1 Tax=Mycobacterium sp. TaxID=1785 RepID=UPI003BE30595
MSDPIQAAERLATEVWDFLSEHHVTGSATEKQRAAIRATAFKFSREVKSGDEWQVAYGRRLAGAVLAWANDPHPENIKALERASRRYEEYRLTRPTK